MFKAVDIFIELTIKFHSYKCSHGLFHFPTKTDLFHINLKSMYRHTGVYYIVVCEPEKLIYEVEDRCG